MSEPDPGAEQVELVAASLRHGTADLSLYAGFLLTTLSEALPREVVEVEWRRSLRDRVTGAPGHVVGVHVLLGDDRYSLTRAATGARPTASVRHEVGGVVLRRQSLPLDAWAQRLAQALLRYTVATGRSAEALAELLRPRGLE